MHSADLRPLPPHPNVEHYKKQAKDLLRSVSAASPEALERVRTRHPSPAVPFALADAQFVIAREHGFESWPKFSAHVEHLRRSDSTVARFESAADAIVAGDALALTRLLRENPGLIGERSSRAHRATLLHYIGANGVEQYRQQSPSNAVEIAALLLDAGAEVDALAPIYGQSTTLGLTATSVHPLRAGVQIPLMQLLIERGADVEGNGTGSPLIAALHNGRGEAAEFLAQSGATLDLEGASGVGRLDLVMAHFKSDGTLRAGSTRAQLESGFAWACEYGRIDVVDFLLQHGIDIGALYLGQTGLHWAVIGAQLETVRFLLDRRAPLGVLNVYGGTPLDQAVWSAAHSDAPAGYEPVISALKETTGDRPRR